MESKGEGGAGSVAASKPPAGAYECLTPTVLAPPSRNLLASPFPPGTFILPAEREFLPAG
jgi:hypothetical protein